MLEQQTANLQVSAFSDAGVTHITAFYMNPIMITRAQASSKAARSLQYLLLQDRCLLWLLKHYVGAGNR